MCTTINLSLHVWLADKVLRLSKCYTLTRSSPISSRRRKLMSEMEMGAYRKVFWCHKHSLNSPPHRWAIDWLTAWLPDWLTECVNEWINESMNQWRYRLSLIWGANLPNQFRSWTSNKNRGISIALSSIGSEAAAHPTRLQRSKTKLVIPIRSSVTHV